MSSKSYQLALLSDIVQNVERIQNYVGDLRRDDFERDARTQDAVERCLERICEAAVRLGDDADAIVPEQPWNEIRGMGKWLRHAYDRVDSCADLGDGEGDLPSLANAVRAALGEHPL